MVQRTLVAWFGTTSEWWDVVLSDQGWVVEQIDAGADRRIAHRQQIALFAFKDDAMGFARMRAGE